MPSKMMLDDEAHGRIEGMARQRASRVPFERIVGVGDFAGLEIEVSPDVFMPYSESRPVAEHAIALLEKLGGPLRLLDLGCGTGCLLLALLRAIPDASGTGIDISSASIALARKNATRNRLHGRALFQKSSWLDDLGEAFDFVIANPPRVPTTDISLLIPEMRDHDPHLALDGEKDGLAFYRAMLDRLPRLLKPGGYGLFQISPSHARQVQAMFDNAGYREVIVKNNYMQFPCAVMMRT